MPFGLNIEVKEMDEFLVQKIQRKIRFYCLMHLPLVRESDGGQLNVSIFFMNFLEHLKGGFEKVVRKCKTLMKSFYG